MITLIKTLDIQNASLNMITAGRRLPLARFTGKIEITEHRSMTPILGRMCKGEKKSTDRICGEQVTFPRHWQALTR